MISVKVLTSALVFLLCRHCQGVFVFLMNSRISRTTSLFIFLLYLFIVLQIIIYISD